mgnify:FL=1
MQVLWNKFIAAKADEITAYIKRVQRDYVYLPQVYQTFMEDI